MTKRDLSELAHNSVVIYRTTLKCVDSIKNATFSVKVQVGNFGFESYVYRSCEVGRLRPHRSCPCACAFKRQRRPCRTRRFKRRLHRGVQSVRKAAHAKSGDFAPIVRAHALAPSNGKGGHVERDVSNVASIEGCKACVKPLMRSRETSPPSFVPMRLRPCRTRRFKRRLHRAPLYLSDIGV